MRDAQSERKGALNGTVTRRMALFGLAATMTSLLAACGGAAQAPSAPTSAASSAAPTAVSKTTAPAAASSGAATRRQK